MAQNRPAAGAHLSPTHSSRYSILRPRDFYFRKHLAFANSLVQISGVGLCHMVQYGKDIPNLCGNSAYAKHDVPNARNGELRGS